MRKNVVPSSTKNDTKNVSPKIFDSFGRGTIKDPPAKVIGDCLADSSNVSTFPNHYEGRLGCRFISGANFPTMVTGIVASKSGKNIVATTSVFTRHHVGCFFNFGGTFELITDYVSGTTVAGEDTTYRETLSGSIIGTPIIFDMHSTVRKFYLLLGTEFYSSDDNFSWTKIKTISPNKAFMRESMYCEYKNKVIVFNGNGIFRIDLDKTYPVAYQINIDPPTTRLVDATESTPTCRYRYIFSALKMDGIGIIDRQSVGSVIDFETGTNKKDANDIDYGEYQTANAISSTNPVVVSYFGVPNMANQLQHHVTHYAVYRTLNLEAIDPLDVNKSKYNDPNTFIWVKDLRCCAAFYCHVTNGHLYVDRGKLEIADVGSVIRFIGNQVPTITEFISETEAILSDESLNLTDVAAAIGASVLQGEIVDGVLTRTDGGIFSTSIDLPLLNSDGEYIFIEEWLTSSSVRTNVVGDQPEQGYAFTPSSRSFNDTIEEDTLVARKDFYTCVSRYKTPLPNCNIGTIIPGFMVVGQRWQKKVYYSSIEPENDYLMGSNVAIQTSDKISDAITYIKKFQDVLSFICASSTWYMQLGLSEFATLPGSNKEVAIIPGIKELTKGVGCVDYGSIVDIPGEMIALITNEGKEEVGRFFNGTSFFDTDWLVDSVYGGRIVKALRKTKKLSRVAYDGLMGLIVWRKNE